ncbi:MAG: aa3-type cytochrome c oxidase subunit IV [Rhodospirillales bacterium]|nr:aa3-type cytochrome c oxidase subunit IV [Rhodospirillales bacterium]
MATNGFGLGGKHRPGVFCAEAARSQGALIGEFQGMAEQPHGDAHDFDMAAHEHSWKVFNRILVWGMVVVVLILLFLMWIHYG